MSKVENIIKRYEIGDKVKIKELEEFKNSQFRNPNGKMDNLAGQIMTVATTYPNSNYSDAYLMQEDDGLWFWYNDMIAEKVK